MKMEVMLAMFAKKGVICNVIVSKLTISLNVLLGK